MAIEDIKQELIAHGKNPDDFNIKLFENGYSVTPKWFFENKEIAKKEDKPIKEDVNDVAITTAYVLEDSMVIAETVAFLLLKIDSLETEIATLKGE